ncbi:MAG: DUF378 domain-containing protein [Nanoarchaeota archaeon]|nr:DUF378 domain-containing protein [Nanoarchaeota archaeon]
MAKKKSNMDTIDWIAFVLVIVGGLNWGLVGFFNYNIVYGLFGTGLMATVTYSLVGLAAVYQIFTKMR